MEWKLIFSFLLCNGIYSAGQVPRPRGVSLSKAPFYGSGVEFACLDGSMTIGFDRVNDDYCDCDDGSDEPGTAACPNGSFHCTNAGYKPSNIPSSMADDGICDCCDGTDEYTGKVTCENTCRELGKQMREDQEKQRALVKEGYEVYKEYVQQGTAAKAEKQEHVEGFRSEQETLKTKRDELDEIKKEAERLEKEATSAHKEAWEAEKEKLKTEINLQKAQDAFNDLDADSNGLVTVPEMQTRPEFDIDNNGEVAPEEAQEYLEDNEDVEFELFFEKVWENIKQVYRVPGSEAAGNIPEEAVTHPSLDVDAIPNPHEDDDEHHDDGSEDDYYDGDDDDEDDFPSRNYPRGDEDDEDSKYDDKGTKAKDDSDVDLPMPEYNEETKRLIEEADQARENHKEASRTFDDVDRDLKETEDLLNLDLGGNNQFYPLRGQCYEYTDREYTYKLCPFDKCSQRGKNGGSETSLGRWGQWSGPDNDRYSIMLFEKGQNCWHGPDRQAKVIVSCGINNELLSAAEPNRCEYEFTFTSPAACSQLAQLGEAHDEL